MGLAEAPLFLTVSVTPPFIENKRPGDTDPHVPLALQLPIKSYRATEAAFLLTQERLTVLINELGYQSQKMVQGGKKAWWDTQNFQAIIPVGVDYQCTEKLGAKGILQARDCRDASYGFVKQGDAPLITPNTPINTKSGKEPGKPRRRL